MRQVTSSTAATENKDIDAMWQVIADQYEIVRLIGAGTYSQVIHARHIQSKLDVAIKLMKNCFRNDYEAKKLLNEI